jgi:hypothetical protein
MKILAVGLDCAVPKLLLGEERLENIRRLDDETAVLALSDHGAQRLDGGFCVNEWLVREGFLVLNRYPDVVTPFDQLDVDWERTRAWGDGGYDAWIFLNVAGREPRGALLELAGHDIPGAMQGRSLVTGWYPRRRRGPTDAVDFDDPSVRDRLSALGYIA